MTTPNDPNGWNQSASTPWATGPQSDNPWQDVPPRDAGSNPWHASAPGGDNPWQAGGVQSAPSADDTWQSGGTPGFGAGNPAANPYAAPSAAVYSNPMTGYGGTMMVPADRGKRLVAKILDGVAIMALFMIVGLFGMMFGVGAGAFGNNGEFSETGFAMVYGGIVIVAGLVYLVPTWMLLSANGQTIGKKLMRIKIVRTDGSPASPGRITGMRWFLPSVLGNVPYVGGVFGLADCLFIFRDDRRCIHDMMADTVVVSAEFDSY